MPVKNGEARIERALDSVARQQWPHELIVVDGGSEDDTLAILQRRRGDIATLITKTDNSATEAVNRAADTATGDVICLLMSDDWSPPTALAAIGQTFADNPDVEIVCGGVQTLNELEGNASSHTEVSISPSELGLKIESILGVPYAAAYSFSASLWRSLKGLSTDYRYGADRDLLMRAFLAGARLELVDAPVYGYCVNETSDTLVENPHVVRAFLEDHRRMASHWLSDPLIDQDVRSAVQQWLTIQIMELATRRVREREWIEALGLIGSHIGRNPRQVLQSLRWFGSRLGRGFYPKS